MIDACDQFALDPEDNPWTGYGRTPTPWMRCTTCGHPNARHEDPHCHSQAIVRGLIYTCARRTPHHGLRCTQDDAEWGMP